MKDKKNTHNKQNNFDNYGKPNNHISIMIVFVYHNLLLKG